MAKSLETVEESERVDDTTTSYEVAVVYEEADLGLLVSIGEVEVEVDIISFELSEIVVTSEGLNDDIVELEMVTHVGHTAEVEVDVVENVAEL